MRLFVLANYVYDLFDNSLSQARRQNMTTYAEGRRSPVLRRVKFEFGYQYIGFNRFCRVLLIPALGGRVANVDGTELRYVTYQKDLWHLIFLQTGFCYQISEPLEEYAPGQYRISHPLPIKSSELSQYVATPVRYLAVLPGGTDDKGNCRLLQRQSGAAGATK